MRKLWNPDSSPIPCFLFFVPVSEPPVFSRSVSPSPFFRRRFFFGRLVCRLFFAAGFFGRLVCRLFSPPVFFRSVSLLPFFAAGFFLGRFVRRLFIRRRFFLCCRLFFSHVFFSRGFFLFAGRRSCNFFLRCFCGTAGAGILSEPALRGFFSAFSPPMLPNC